MIRIAFLFIKHNIFVFVAPNKIHWILLSYEKERSSDLHYISVYFFVKNKTLLYFNVKCKSTMNNSNKKCEKEKKTSKSNSKSWNKCKLRIELDQTRKKHSHTQIEIKTESRRCFEKLWINCAIKKLIRNYKCRILHSRIETSTVRSS